MLIWYITCDMINLSVKLPIILSFEYLHVFFRFGQVFFPIIASEHYYLIVFNIQKGYAVIIDNSESDATYDGKYKDIYELVVRTVFYNK